MAFATALKEQYQQLGFRVIEGGKSEKLAIITTRGVAEIFGKRHDNVLGDVREYQEKLPSNLRTAFAEHCRVSNYRARDNTTRESYDLTKVGFNAFAAKYDTSLRFLLALAFDALERDDATAGRTIIRQVDARIRELRGRKSGHKEFDFGSDDAIAPVFGDPARDANQRHLDAIAGAGHGLASTWAGDVVEEPKAENPYIGVRSPPTLWGVPLEKQRAHHHNEPDGRAFMCCCFLKEGLLAEFAIHQDPMHSVNMKERFLLQNTPQEFLCRFEWSVSPVDCGAIIKPRACVPEIENDRSASRGGTHVAIRRDG